MGERSREPRSVERHRHYRLRCPIRPGSLGCTSVGSARVPGFRPSSNGLGFSNAFPKGPLFRLLGIPIGNASNGICGGMAFAARDLFEAGLRPPADTSPPAPGTPLFRYLVRRLFASFDLPLGPLRYLLWMMLPKGNRFGLRGVSWRTIRRHWPRVRS